MQQDSERFFEVEVLKFEAIGCDGVGTDNSEDDLF